MILAFSFITLKIITSTFHFHSVEFPVQCPPTPLYYLGIQILAKFASLAVCLMCWIVCSFGD